MLNNRPTYFTEKQSELLQLIYPGPIGEGVSIAEACRKLEISEGSGYARLKCFKTRFPDAYKQFEVARKINSEHRKQLYSGAEYGYSIEEPYNFGWDKRIKERF